MANLMSVNKLSSATVYIVDDDDIILWTLKELVRSIGARVLTYSSAKDFLTAYTPTPCECVISDVRMPDIGGLQIQRLLVSRGAPPPIIFITSHSEISAAVEAMKAGAFDFVEKPVNGHMLIEKVQAALTHSPTLHKERLSQSSRQARMDLLTPKERAIVDLVVLGQSSREIASALDISVRTVENHRARIMDKLHIASAVELVKLFV
jgi:two-component system, LuxR family, response regulator FixJ